MQSSVEDMPKARILPGSDTISLELNVKGMTEPNKEFCEPDSPTEKTTLVST